METDEQSAYLTSRRSFLVKGAAAGAVTLGAGRLLGDASPAFASGGLTKGDAAILRSWPRPRSSRPTSGSSTTSSPGSRTARSRAEAGTDAYTEAVAVLDEDMPQYIHDNTDDEISHATSSTPIWRRTARSRSTWTSSAPCRAARPPAPSRIGRLTNLMQLTINTSFWTRYRSDSQNPDLGDILPQAVPDLAVGQHPAIPRSDDDLDAAQPPAGDREHGRLPLRLDRAGRHEPLRLARPAGHQPGGAANPAQHRRQRDHALPDLAGQGRQRSAAHRPRDGADLPRPQRRRRADPDQPDHARADDIPRSEVPGRLDHPAHRDRGRRDGRGQNLTANGLFIGQSAEFFAVTELAEAADAARHGS